MSNVPSECDYFFAVGAPETVMSSLWKVRTKPGKKDIYISESGSSDSFHVSLHRNNECHVAVMKEFVKYGRNRGKPNPAKSMRYPDKWKATEIAPGIKMPFRLLIPVSDLRPPAPGWNTTNQVRWLPPPPANFVYEIRMYLSKNDFTVHSPDGDVAELWQVSLADEWVLVLLAKSIPFPYEEQQKLELVRQHALKDMATLSTSVREDGRLRIIARGSADDGSRHFIDMALDVPTLNKV